MSNDRKMKHRRIAVPLVVSGLLGALLTFSDPNAEGFRGQLELSRGQPTDSPPSALPSYDGTSTGVIGGTAAFQGAPGSLEEGNDAPGEPPSPS